LVSNEAATPPTIGQVVGAELRALRRGLGITQEEALQRVRAEGLDWTLDTLSRLEVGKREELSLGEVVLLAEAFGMVPTDWFSEDGEIRVGSARIQSRWLRTKLGASPGRRHGLPAGPVLDGPERGMTTEAEAHAAKVLGVSTLTVTLAAVHLWEHRLDEERERRLDRDANATPRQRQARRGHVSRQLLLELREEIARLQQKTAEDEEQERLRAELLSRISQSKVRRASG
jgi:transcriptional regulator with XRE-family HTH domain